jgi:hypothetical protein
MRARGTYDNSSLSHWTILEQLRRNSPDLERLAAYSFEFSLRSRADFQKASLLDRL